MRVDPGLGVREPATAQYFSPRLPPLRQFPFPISDHGDNVLGGDVVEVGAGYESGARFGW
jgi:hypothetical protein